MTILVTGSSGFIGFHLARRLLKANAQVIGIDHLNNYYDPNLKKERTKILKQYPNFTFYQMDIADKKELTQIFSHHPIQVVIHLAAQAGVRYSMIDPDSYTHSNLTGFMNILEAIRHHPVEHFIFASSSAVYGGNQKIPFSTKDRVDRPVSLYGATKKANEVLAYAYSHLFQIPTTGLRFFTVYGPWGRPDMAYFKFTKNILEDKPIQVYNYGDMMRDFTYIDDIVEGIVRLIDHPPKILQHSLNAAIAPFKIYNIGNNRPVKLTDFIKILEKLCGKKARIEYLPMQPGDVKETYAAIDDIQEEIGFKPNTPLEVGLKKFVDWYKTYYKKLDSRAKDPEKTSTSEVQPAGSFISSDMKKVIE